MKLENLKNLILQHKFLVNNNKIMILFFGVLKVMHGLELIQTFQILYQSIIQRIKQINQQIIALIQIILYRMNKQTMVLVLIMDRKMILKILKQIKLQMKLLETIIKMLLKIIILAILILPKIKLKMAIIKQVKTLEIQILVKTLEIQILLKTLKIQILLKTLKISNH